MSRGAHIVLLEERALRLLLCLAKHAGTVLSSDELLKQVWPGVIVSPDAIHQAISSLRRQLGDDPIHPAYIATVPGRGYRFIATVSSAAREPGPRAASWLAGDAPPQSEAGRHSGPLLLVIALLVLVGGLIALGMLSWETPAQVGALPAGTSLYMLA